ncbi:YdcF family protein [Microbacterium sp.]|uniref:YdcF family protein n=1 Tax=Microbacterium sp. TaxID=51671 RepID=UPI002D01F88F|nr:YdcF family protein [Microbacterium sp.]HWK77189.1 YdcF family protein [Microbacterium sp.]
MSSSRGVAGRLFWAGFAAYSVFAVWAEYVHWRSSRRMLGAAVPASSTEAVVVLGYGNRGERANFINRYRVRAGIRSIDRDARSTVVMCGGTVEGDVPEAVIMERYAREELDYTGHIVLEPDSRSTWENIENAIPLIEHADRIKIVSNSPHAEVAREYLRQQRPDLADRLVRADEHRFGEIVPMKIGASLRLLLFRWQHR